MSSYHILTMWTRSFASFLLPSLQQYKDRITTNINMHILHPQPRRELQPLLLWVSPALLGALIAKGRTQSNSSSPGPQEVRKPSAHQLRYHSNEVGSVQRPAFTYGTPKGCSAQPCCVPNARPLIWLAELTCGVSNTLPILQACEGFSFFPTDKIQLLLFIFLTAEDCSELMDAAKMKSEGISGIGTLLKKDG